jgi:hypothetical protein
MKISNSPPPPAQPYGGREKGVACSAALKICLIKKWVGNLSMIKGIVSRDFVVCFLVSFDSSEVPTPTELVHLLFKFRFRLKTNILLRCEGLVLTLIFTAGCQKDHFFQRKISAWCLSKLFIKNQKCLAIYLSKLFCFNGFTKTVIIMCFW